jgi:hypothetical protein
MKRNQKQINWARKKIFAAQMKRLSRFVLCVIMLFVGISVAAFAVEQWMELPDLLTTTGVLGTIGGTVIYGGILAVNIDDPPNEKKVGRQVKARLWVLSEDQLDDTVPFPTRVNREIGDLPLKTGEKWHYIHAVYDSIRPTWAGEEGEIASQITNELPFVVGGMDDAVLDLLEKGLNKGFYIVWEICANGQRFIGGNGCKPMRLVSFEGRSNEESTSNNLVFRNQCGQIWSKYVGNTPTQDPQLVAADATEITLTSNPRYQLTSGTAAAAVITGFAAVTDADINRTVTVMGSGGAHPSTIVAGGDFLLIGGVTWEAGAKKKISFRIFKEAASTYKFVEVSGTRA